MDWLKRREKQNKFKSYCAAVCDFSLISGSELLLPFIFRIPYTDEFINPAEITRWVLRNEDCETVLDESLVNFYYNGIDLRLALL